MPRAKKSTWLKGCDVCNVGLINAMDEVIEKKGVSVNKASQLLADESERQTGVKLYTANALMQRYRLHKGLKVCHGDKQDTPQTTTTSQSKKNESTKNVPIETEQPEIRGPAPEPMEMTAEFHAESHKAAADAKKPKKSELEKASTVIEKAAQLLERIVDGDLEDNGTDEDQLIAESIIRQGPGIIISFFRLGIDPEQAVNFYKGVKNDESAINVKGSLRVEGNATNNR